MWFLYYRHLLLVFLSLHPKGTYAKNCLLFLHQLHHWKCNELPIIDILERSIYSFNEEMGETTFATLGRTVISDNDRCSLDKLRFSFQAQPYVQASVAASQSAAGDTAPPVQHVSTDHFPQELLVVKQQLGLLFTSLIDASYRPLDSSILKQQSFVKEDGLLHKDVQLEDLDFTRLRIPRFDQQAEALTKLLQQLLEKAED
jgi:hypothetical protein